MKGRFHDMVNLGGKLTVRRVLNAAKVLGSYYRSRLSGKPILSGMPVALSVEPTTHCNLRCPECPSGLRKFSRPTGMLTVDLFRKVIDELSPDLLYLLLYFQGEPYLHPQFSELVNYASRKGIYTATSTNAHYLTDARCRSTIESGLDRLIISIDGATQETYESYRIGGSLEKVLEGTKRLVEWKRKLKSNTPHIIFQFLVVKPNEHETEEVKRLASEAGVDEIRFKTAQIYDYENGSPLIPTIDKYSRYKRKNDGRWELKNKMLNQCWKMWHSSVVTWDGRVVPCCFDKDATHVFGSVEENSTFKEIWQSGSYDAFRKALLTSRSEIDICKNCTEGTKVWA
ncbi:radical SAM/SPASM domain-containing protein [Roseivirga sp. BDSF3-8]|uniref:radical SAM/SPASM domain-containing protein n=1 Tax=Roseivirga sp. BDSF3-8 TaxID=3241598 RepID=UPI003532461A